jgi:hypothetical protein
MLSFGRLAQGHFQQTMQAHLSLEDGSRVAVAHGMTIGRVPGNDLVIKDTKASRRHACIHFEGGVAEVEDLQSSNGTLLNGRPVDRKVVRDGDVIRIGTTEIVFREGPAVPAASARPAEPLAPAAPTAPAAAPAQGVGDGDDVDLFADEPMQSVDDAFDGPADDHLPPPPPGVQRVPLPPMEQAPPPVRPASIGVVEFEDEVIEVRKQVAPKAGARLEPMGDDGPRIESQRRVLQYSNTHKPGGVLADDLSQMSGLMRALVVLAVLVIGAGIVWLLMTLVGS